MTVPPPANPGSVAGTTGENMKIIKINIYRHGKTWCYAAWNSDGEHDHSDTLEVSTEAEAREEVGRVFPDGEIKKVADV